MSDLQKIVVVEDFYKEIKLVITARQLGNGQWQAAFSGGGFDATTDPDATLEGAQASAKDMAKVLIGRWLG